MRRVLLADGWHVIDRGSFDLDAYEFAEVEESAKPRTVFSGGQSNLVPCTGFTFLENGNRIDGPITSILAVETITGKFD